MVFPIIPKACKLSKHSKDTESRRQTITEKVQELLAGLKEELLFLKVG